MINFVAILLTALLSALTTIALAVWYVRRVLEPRLQATLSEQSEILTSAIETRVKAGVEAGIASGIEQAASADTLVKATRSATRSGASLVEDGLNALLGAPRRKPDDS